MRLLFLAPGAGRGRVGRHQRLQVPRQHPADGEDPAESTRILTRLVEPRNGSGRVPPNGQAPSLLCPNIEFFPSILPP